MVIMEQRICIQFMRGRWNEEKEENNKLEFKKLDNEYWIIHGNYYDGGMWVKSRENN